MTSDGRKHYEDWDLFALGALDREEQQEMAAHLASGCDDCMQLYLSAEVVVAGLATLSPDVQLPPEAETRLKKRLAAAGAGAAEPARPEPASPAGIWGFWNAAPWALAAACLVAAIWLGVNLHNTANELREQQRQNVEYQLRQQQQPPVSPNPAGEITSAQAAELRNNIEALKRDLENARSEKLAAEQELKTAQAKLEQAQTRLAEMNASLTQSEARRAEAEQSLASAHLQLAKAEADANKLAQTSAQNDQIIALLQAAPLSQLDLKPVAGVRASARVFWQNDRGLLLVARDLPRLPEHASFQLWFYRQGSPGVVNVGTLRVENSGSGLLFVPPGPALLAMSGALVTEEPESSSASTPGEEILKIKP
jgi:hypothetical protein